MQTRPGLNFTQCSQIVTFETLLFCMLRSRACAAISKQPKRKAVLERNSVQPSPPHKQESNTIICFSQVLMGGRKSDPSLHVSQRQWPHSVIIYRAEHLKHFLTTPTKKGFLSNNSPKTLHLSLRLKQPHCQSTTAGFVPQDVLRQLLTAQNPSEEETAH